MQCVTLGSLFAEFGLPYYLKIDVEGVDQSVLEQLRGSDLLPLYVSVEDCRFGFQYMQTRRPAATIASSCWINPPCRR